MKLCNCSSGMHYHANNCPILPGCEMGYEKTMAGRMEIAQQALRNLGQQILRVFFP